MLWRALLAGMQRVMAHRDELDRINVYPVPDRDTGTNLAFTLGAVWQGAMDCDRREVRGLLRGVAAAAADGARGNAGAILAHFFHGAGEAAPAGRRLTLPDLARAVQAGADEARKALAEPAEGTILSVMDAFAGALAAEAGGDLKAGFQRGLEAARAALAQSPRHQRALRRARVVDAGAAGFVELLEGVANFVELGRALARAETPPESGLLGTDALARMARLISTGPAPLAAVAIATDSGADLPKEEAERLRIHVVPQRLSLGRRDLVDGVSMTPREFYTVMRKGAATPRTSQPPPGDFRRLFEGLLARHEAVIDVAVSRRLSGTFQAAAGAAARVDAGRVKVFDSRQVAAGQGLLAIWAAEAAAAGLGVERVLEGLERVRERMGLYAVVRDMSYAVRGGRVPAVALPLTRWLRVSPILCARPDGKLGLAGGLWGRADVPERFARRIARGLDPARCYRLMVGHSDCAEDAERVKAALLAGVRNVDRLWVVETGAAIGCHAGPDALVIGVQDYEPPTADRRAGTRALLTNAGQDGESPTP